MTTDRARLLVLLTSPRLQIWGEFVFCLSSLEELAYKEHTPLVAISDFLPSVNWNQTTTEMLAPDWRRLAGEFLHRQATDDAVIESET